MGLSNYVTDHLQSPGPANWPRGASFPPGGARHCMSPQQVHSELVGQSPALREILTQVEVVASTNSTVLIVGETGTGKELIARALHNFGSRREQPFIKVNCAAIPTGLLESELFGHERGAFTGAISQRIGRFELAQLGTLFLDEVGDIPLELQPKLLRVLQEKEFERLGGARTLHVDIRLVAATSCKLAQMVENREFRSDLYYRLNVFPINVPPLRDRREDVTLLTWHFVKKYAQQMNKSIDRIPEEIIRALSRYDWPGNIRELQNVIERAVILTQGKTLAVPLEELERPSSTTQANHATTLKEVNRQHILRTLGETGWAIGGPRGAAARLGIPRTSLLCKMQKLGIPARRDMCFALAESPGAGRMTSKAPFVNDLATLET